MVEGSIDSLVSAIDIEIQDIEEILADLPEAAAEGLTHQDESRAAFLMSDEAPQVLQEELQRLRVRRAQLLQRKSITEELARIRRICRSVDPGAFCDAAHALLKRVRTLARSGHYAAALHAAKCPLGA